MSKLSKEGNITYRQYLEAIHTVRLYSKQVALHRTEIQMDMDSISKFLGVSEDTLILDLPLTRRTLNVLERMENLDCSRNTLKDMEKISLKELSAQKNMGQKTMFEIEEPCLYTGVKLLP